MLKAVSSITNAIGAVNYKGVWNASTNSPALASGAGTKGDYYIVGTAGTTSIDSTATWYVGDWIVFNGSAWQRLQGGADDPAPSVKSNATTGVLQITGPAAAATRVMTVPDANFTAARTDAAQSFTGDQTLATGNMVVGTAGKGVDFSVNTNAAGMTKELLDWYEEGTWTPTLDAVSMSDQVYAYQLGTYTRIGRQVTVRCYLSMTSFTNGSGNYSKIAGLPFVPATNSLGSLFCGNLTGGTNGRIVIGRILTDSSIYFYEMDSDGGVNVGTGLNSSRFQQTVSFEFAGSYFV